MASRILKSLLSVSGTTLLKKIESPVGFSRITGSINCRRYGDSARESTVKTGESEKFAAMVNEWWNPKGPLSLLHSMNVLRIPFIKDGLASTGAVSDLDNPEPLKGLKILDIGCGGGILCEPLARLGASVTGIDITDESLEVARLHKGDLDIDYVCSSIEDFAKNPSAISTFDAVVASEVIEHVSNADLFVKHGASLLKPAGSMFITTINRTPASRFAVIFAAEYLLQIVPKGTHKWEDFVTPEELQRWLTDSGVETRRLNGTFYNPLTDTWAWSHTTDILYSLHGVKVE